MQCVRLSSIVVAVVVMMVPLSQAQYGPPPGAAAQGGAAPGAGAGGAGGYGYQPPPQNSFPQVSNPQCRYLVTAPTWATASPFKLGTRCRSPIIQNGFPVEVRIEPEYAIFRFFNFTDFGCWAESEGGMPPGPNHVNPATPAMGMGKTMVGKWRTFPRFSGGASSMHCNQYGNGVDSVGSVEERYLEILRHQFYWDNRLKYIKPSSRTWASFLWYPDNTVMNTAHAVNFVCKLKSNGQWIKLQSRRWRVFQRPPPPPPMSFNGFIDSVSHLAGRAKTMERRFDKADVPGF